MDETPSTWDLMIVTGIRRGLSAATRLSSTFRSTPRLWAAAALLVAGFGLSAAAPTPTPASTPATTVGAPLVLVQEVGQRIAFSAPVSASAKASFTFRLQRADDSVKEVSFLATDLVTSNGKRIPRQKITVSGASFDANPKDFTIVVDGIDTIGQFAGQLLVRSPQVPTGMQTIDVAVTVSPIAAPTFAVENPKLKLQLAQACGPYTRFVLGGTHCPGTFGLPFSVPTGTQDPNVDLLLVDANNAAIEPENAAGASAVTTKDGKVLVNLSDNALPPGHYSGRVRATFAATGEQIQAPVEIDVRVAAGMPTLLIIAGILVGRLQALMTSSGNAVLAASRRLDRIRVRSNSLWNDAQMALSATSGQIAYAVSARDIPLATQLLTKQEVCLRALETAQPLGREPINRCASGASLLCVYECQRA